MQFKKHIHADLIKEYARQKAEGELGIFLLGVLRTRLRQMVQNSKPNFP